jgi:lysophospholipase L1-like esterase
MRSTFFFAALLVAVALAALLVARNRDEPATAGSRGTVTLVGDSLNLGVERYLSAALPGWKLVANDRVGRSTPEGIAELEAGRPPLSSYIVVSLGTNDPPAAVAAFRDDVARLLDLIGPNRCVIWATIWRQGAPNDAFNAVLRDAADANHRVRLVEWAEMVQAHPDWLASDGVHGNEEGYRQRAHAVAEAAKGCAPAQTVTAR